MDINTYEDLEAFYAANGWGCKCCGQLSSASWWTASGDSYCLSCKTAMKAELGRSVKFTKVPNRPAGQAPAVFEIDPSRFGHELAASVRAEYADMHATN